MPPKYKVGLLVFVVCVCTDQLTKYLVETHLHFGDQRTVIDGFFYLTHVRNPGAAFGLGAGWPAAFRIGFFLSVSAVAVGIILSFFHKLAPGDRLSALALGCILGGAVGNLIDRLRYQEVVDFLHFRLWQGYSWPDFNFADSFIVVGVALLVLEMVATEGGPRVSAEHD
ncbi:MAG: signal peptidase II [Myxococcota bacterium]|nr:signal peptidase II [Myxococcota bacterium]